MKIVYFDMCAIPLFLMILLVCHSRKMTRGNANRLFILVVLDKSMLDEVFSVNGWMILEHTIRMMQSIGKQIVAEGAETGEVVEILKGMNCDHIQGYFFSQPLPAEEFVRLIREPCAGAAAPADGDEQGK